MTGKQVRLFLVDGTAGGLMTAEIGNWTGHILRGRREKLSEIRVRPEAQRTGVYVLLGEDTENSSGKIAYIGQSDNVAHRLASHDTHKDFWDEVLIITSKDLNLTSAHVRFLEANLVSLAKSIGRVPLLNGNEPTGGAELPEADRSDMEYFMEQIRVLFPVLGVDMFRGRSTRPAHTKKPAMTTVPIQEEPEVDSSSDSPIFHLAHRKSGADASAQVIDGEFTVLAGSAVAPSISRGGSSVSSQRHWKTRSDLREKLVAEGSITLDSEGRPVLTRDVVFSSPSSAGCIVAGRPTINGRTSWVTSTGSTYAAWEDSTG